MGRRGRAPGLRATRVVALGRRVEAAAELELRRLRLQPAPQARTKQERRSGGRSRSRCLSERIDVCESDTGSRVPDQRQGVGSAHSSETSEAEAG
jgi:hypothetical protein